LVGAFAIAPLAASHYQIAIYSVSNFLATALIPPRKAAFQAVRKPLGPQISPSAGDMPAAQSRKARSAIFPTTFWLDCR
jgi:hypothetical protein